MTTQVPITRPPRTIGLKELDAKFNQAREVLEHLRNINNTIVTSCATFSKSFGHTLRDPTLATCMQRLKSDLRGLKCELNLASWLKIDMTTGLITFAPKLPLDLPSPLARMLDSFKTLIHEIKQVMETTFPVIKKKLDGMVCHQTHDIFCPILHTRSTSSMVHGCFVLVYLEC